MNISSFQHVSIIFMFQQVSTYYNCVSSCFEGFLGNMYISYNETIYLVFSYSKGNINCNRTLMTILLHHCYLLRTLNSDYEWDISTQQLSTNFRPTFLIIKQNIWVFLSPHANTLNIVLIFFKYFLCQLSCYVSYVLFTKKGDLGQVFASLYKFLHIFMMFCHHL